MVNSPAATRMPYKALPDPVPLGVSGSVTVPLKAYRVRVGHDPDARALLLDDTARVAYITVRLADALDQSFGWNRPKNGTAVRADKVLLHFCSFRRRATPSRPVRENELSMRLLHGLYQQQCDAKVPFKVPFVACSWFLGE